MIDLTNIEDMQRMYTMARQLVDAQALFFSAQARRDTRLAEMHTELAPLDAEVVAARNLCAVAEREIAIMSADIFAAKIAAASTEPTR